MFTPAYFPSSYFARRYWPGAPTFPALGPAIAALIAPLVGGRAFGDMASRGTARPYAVFTDVSAVTEEDTDTGGVDEYEVQLCFFATGRHVARSLAWQAHRQLDRAAVGLDEGALIYLRPTGPPLLLLDPEPDEQGRDLWQAVLTVRGLIER